MMMMVVVVVVIWTPARPPAIVVVMMVVVVISPAPPVIVVVGRVVIGISVILGKLRVRSLGGLRGRSISQKLTRVGYRLQKLSV